MVTFITGFLSLRSYFIGDLHRCYQSILFGYEIKPRIVFHMLVLTEIHAIYSRAMDKISINLTNTIYDEKTTFNKTRSPKC